MAEATVITPSPSTSNTSEVEKILTLQDRDGTARNGVHIVGAFKVEGKILVEVASKEIAKLHSPDARKLAYDYRIMIGLASAGIEDYSGVEAIQDTTVQPDAKGHFPIKYYRRFYRLNPGV